MARTAASLCIARGRGATLGEAACDQENPRGVKPVVRAPGGSDEELSLSAFICRSHTDRVETERVARDAIGIGAQQATGATVLRVGPPANAIRPGGQRTRPFLSLRALELRRCNATGGSPARFIRYASSPHVRCRRD